ncbi:shikimate kinase [Egibacter rhizosphaerae]|uniref:Shikimate kinase n=1 Tax=Egibacter rhizosphaerae TaxID=1670831 RepID=A0A411YK14_9ACTN|nr:shikimate kinase [Egibacter rhizosphaerae]QBI21527.1 shikimate kinase [Egibacter rhizosphaerae]
MVGDVHRADGPGQRLPDNVALIGPMGVGKSTAGRKLAARLGLVYVDTDELVIEAAGRSVSELFAAHGEGEFRRLEADAIRAACERTGLVISVGGGAILRAENVERLRANAVVVLLDGDPLTLASRVGRGVRDGSRPLLEGVEDVAARLAALRDERADAHAGAAHVTIDTSGASTRATVGAIVEALTGLAREAADGEPLVPEAADGDEDARAAADRERDARAAADRPRPEAHT